MSVVNSYVGQNKPLKSRIVKAMASLAIAGTVGLAAWTFSNSPTVAGGETRTISLYHVHTKESLTVTYMKDGRYIPSAMKQINYLMRDWRRKEVITIAPKTLDLLWELHADMGSKKPIHIVCGYRSPKTNAFLKRIGRNVANKSQHMRGKAIDFFFPDVSTDKIRNSALARRVGGVGYYRSAGGPTGFLHIDSGNVRHWGPGMSPSQIASLIRQGQKYVGRRMNRNDQVQVADSGSNAGVTGENGKSGGIFGFFKRKMKGEPAEEAAPVEETVVAAAEPAPVESAYSAEDDELADLSADAAAAGKKKPALRAPAPSQVASADDAADPDSSAELAALTSSASVEALGDEQPAAPAKAAVDAPKPKLKPKIVMAMAARATAPADDVQIQPVSAEPDAQTWAKKPSQVAKPLANIANDVAAETDVAALDGSNAPASNADGKSSLDMGLRGNSGQDQVLIKPVMASTGTEEPGWWSLFYSNAAASLRRTGAEPAADASPGAVMPVAAQLGPDGTGPAADLTPLHSAEGKGDFLTVNREGKTGLPPLKLRLSQRNDDSAMVE